MIDCAQPPAGEQCMNLEKLLRELRLMKEQPGHRFYAAVTLVLLALLRYPFFSAVIALFSWHRFR